MADDVYEKLSGLKKLKNASYSEIIREMLNQGENEKTETKKDILAYLKTLEKKYKNKPKENISENIDRIIYG
ncbi:hypothetical protein KKE92_04045 [Candidatus Micrarchaeota archaeon]|nr:hypothetical protein [Candidatus Micrarchaeota archaeon]MBU1681393.1 hypothetical protein [Candidatus Micrarchaeota archaeon]